MQQREHLPFRSLHRTRTNTRRPTSTTFSRTLPSAARRARVPPLGPEPWTATASSSPSTRPDRAAFAKINPDGKMTHLGRSTLWAPIWREIRSFKNYGIIGSEAEDHGI